MDSLAEAVDGSSIFIRAIRHHDETSSVLDPCSISDYSLVDIPALDPRYEDQHKAAPNDSSTLGIDVRTVTGCPGSGKTVAAFAAEQHLDLCLRADVGSRGPATGLGGWTLELDALPEVDLDEVDLSVTLFGKKLRRDHIPEPVWPESFLEAMEILAKVLKIEGREVTLEADRIVVHVTDCETQKAIAKAGIADCGIATIQTYQGLVRGLFDKELEIEVEHTQNLNQGAPVCEVVIRRVG